MGTRSCRDRIAHRPEIESASRAFPTAIPSRRNEAWFRETLANTADVLGARGGRHCPSNDERKVFCQAVLFSRIRNGFEDGTIMRFHSRIINGPIGKRGARKWHDLSTPHIGQTAVSGRYHRSIRVTNADHVLKLTNVSKRICRSVRSSSGANLWRAFRLVACGLRRDRFHSTRRGLVAAMRSMASLRGASRRWPISITDTSCKGSAKSAMAAPAADAPEPTIRERVIWPSRCEVAPRDMQ